MHRSAQLECRAIEGQPAQFEISISSETPAARWYGREILSHDAGAVDLSLLNRGGALLFAHGRDVNYGLVPVGKIVRAWLDEEKRQCRAVIEMDEDDPDSARLKSKLEKGMLSGVSIGYRLLTPYQQLKAGDTSANGRFTGPAYVATRWQPHEISLEPVPADPTVGVGRTMEEACEMALKEKQEGTTPAEVLPKEGQRTQEPVPATMPPMQDDGALTRAVQAERERTTQIDALCARFGVDDKTRSQYLSEGQTVDQVRAAILERLSAERPPVAGGIGRETGVTVDELDKVRAAAADGLLIRAGYAPEKPADGAGEFAGMSFSRIAVECLSRSGVEDANRMSAEQLFRRSMTPDSAFVSILSNVANRIVLGSRDTVPTTFQLWTSKASASDFKPTEFYEIGEAGELLEVPQNGELKEARLSDAAVATRRLLTFGRRITFTRQLFINDDIGLVSRTLTRFSLAAQRGINTAVYDLLKQNPVMYDGNRLFSAAHRNLGIGAAPSTATFAEARKKMRTQRDISDNAYLNLSPAYILSSAADETEIEKLLTSLADPGSSNSGVANVFRNRMQLIVDAELDVDSGAQPYYFAADPRMADTIEVCYLNGSETPIVESRMAFDELGVQYRVYIDRGVTLLGYRGLFKNPGKA